MVDIKVHVLRMLWIIQMTMVVASMCSLGPGKNIPSSWHMVAGQFTVFDLSEHCQIVHCPVHRFTVYKYPMVSNSLSFPLIDLSLSLTVHVCPGTHMTLWIRVGNG